MRPTRRFRRNKKGIIRRHIGNGRSCFVAFVLFCSRCIRDVSSWNRRKRRERRILQIASPLSRSLEHRGLFPSIASTNDRVLSTQYCVLSPRNKGTQRHSPDQALRARSSAAARRSTGLRFSIFYALSSILDPLPPQNLHIDTSPPFPTLPAPLDRGGKSVVARAARSRRLYPCESSPNKRLCARCLVLLLAALGLGLAGCESLFRVPEITTTAHKLPTLKAPPGAMRLDVMYVERPSGIGCWERSYGSTSIRSPRSTRRPVAY